MVNMNLLIIALTFISFNLNAAWRVEIESLDTGKAGYTLTQPTKEMMTERIKKLVNISSWMKGVFNETPDNALFSKIEKYEEMMDLGKTRDILENGEIVQIPVLEAVEKERTLYYHPSNFTASEPFDTTTEDTVRADRKTKRDAAMNKLKQGKVLSLKELSDLHR